MTDRRESEMILRELNHRRQQLANHAVIAAVIGGESLAEAKARCADENQRMSEADNRQLAEVPAWESRMDVIKRMLCVSWEQLETAEQGEREALGWWTDERMETSDREALEAVRSHQEMTDEQVDEQVARLEENKSKLLGALRTEFARRGMTDNQSELAALEEFRRRRQMQFHITHRNTSLTGAGADSVADFALFNPEASPEVLAFANQQHRC